jgi:hypothetical protein
MSVDASELSLGEIHLAAVAEPDEVATIGDDCASDLDARQDEVLQMLDELNARIQAVIQQAVSSLPTSADQSAPRSVAA